MMLGNGRIFTPHNLAVVRHMAERGSSSVEIAKMIGSTPASVRVVCSHHKIRLKRGRRYPERTAPAPLDHGRAMSEHTIVARIPARLYADFFHKAEHLQIPVSVLASNLLAAIAISDIYEAVLDDTD
jgi:hypothetical protein